MGHSLLLLPAGSRYRSVAVRRAAARHAAGSAMLSTYVVAEHRFVVQYFFHSHTAEVIYARPVVVTSRRIFNNFRALTDRTELDRFGPTR